MWNTTGEYRMSVLIKGRKPAPEIEHMGVTYIEGREGSNYELELENRTSGRIMFVPSVDGLSILDGKPAGAKSPGYVVEARSVIRIPGWKVDRQMAAEFVFGKVAKGQTYAEASGQNPANQGVIGCMVFREKYVPQQFHNGPFWKGPSKGLVGGGTLRSTSLSASTPTMNSMNSFEPAYAANVSSVGAVASLNHEVGLETLAETSLGTEWGDAVDFKTKQTTFTKEHDKIPNSVFLLYYDSLVNLRYIGVPVEHFSKSAAYKAREAFPADKPLGATPPPGWTPRKKRYR